MNAAAQELVEHVEAQAPAVVIQQGDAMLAMIERAARDPSVNIEKMERLFTMRAEMEARQARAAFAAALAAMQPELPTIDRKGKIKIEKSGVVIQSTAYVLFEDINEAIRPVLAAHGFALTFKSGTTPEGKITVTGILSHSQGHSEDTTLVLMHDSSGSKNAVQAIGSSISYGKRYTAMMLLNITSRAVPDADDDAKAAAGPAMVSEDQIDTIRSLLIETAADIPRFLQFMKVAKVEDIEAARFDNAIKALEAKRAKQ
jgi:ERF superfamily